MGKISSFYKFLDNFSTGVVIHGANTEVLFANPAALKVLGLTKEQIRGKAATDPRWCFIREDLSPMPIEEFPVQRVVASLESLRDLVVGIIRPDLPHPVWAMCNASPEFDENNLLSKVIVNFTDITESKKTAKALSETAQMLQLAYEVSKIGVWKWDVETDSITWSKELYRIAEIDPGSPVPKRSERKEVHTEESWERVNAAVARTLETGLPYEIELEYIMKDGRIKNVVAFGGAKRDHTGKIVELYGTAQDVTEKKQVEKKLKAALEASENATKIKSKFLDIAAHELRTPVTAFSLLVQLAQKKLELGEPVEIDIWSRLRTQSDRISQLVIELLDVSRLERGLLKLKKQESNLKDLVVQCLDDFKPRVKNRTVKFSHPDFLPVVEMDSLRIYQVISNLIDNAIKYTPDDSPLELKVETNSETIIFSIHDMGKGIPDELQEELFHPFARGVADHTDLAGGLGLGLFIAKEIISLHKGEMGVKSKVGEGSTFYFRLPIKGRK